jgi:hypothetical protein
LQFSKSLVGAFCASTGTAASTSSSTNAKRFHPPPVTFNGAIVDDERSWPQRCERAARIAVDRVRERAAQGLAPEQVPTKAIHDGQWMTALRGDRDMAFEIRTPDRVRCCVVRTPLGIGRAALPTATRGSAHAA